MLSPLSACSRERPVASTRRSALFDSTRLGTVAIVVEDALAPAKTKAGISLRARMAASLMGMRLW